MKRRRSSTPRSYYGSAAGRDMVFVGSSRIVALTRWLLYELHEWDAGVAMIASAYFYDTATHAPRDMLIWSFLYVSLRLFCLDELPHTLAALEFT